MLLSTLWPDTLKHQMAVACAITHGVVKFPTAGVAWRFRKSPRVPETHVWILESRRLRPVPGVRVHLTGYLPESDIVRRDDGIDITAPPRTAFDAAATLEFDDLESLVEHGIDCGFFVEVDHLTWHTRRRTSANDRRRDLKARASGFHIERVTGIALDDDLDGTVEQLWIEWRRLVA